MKLLEIAKNARSLNDMLEETGGELTPEIEASLQLTKENLYQKTDAYYWMKEDLEARQAQFQKIKDEAQRCIDVYERNIKMLKNRMGEALKEMGVNESVGEHAKFHFVRTKPVVDCYDILNIPDDYWKTKEEKYVDKITLARDLAAGIEIKGARLVENYSLRATPNNIKSIK